MQLLKLNLPPSARIAWASTEARLEWEPKIQKAARTYHELELLSVVEGLRQCTTMHIAPDRMNELSLQLAKRGLIFLPYKKVGTYSGFAHSHPKVIEGKPWNYYGPVARDIKDAELFCTSEDKGDHDTIGELLGYPECCRKFFTDVWRQGYVDPIWQAAQRSINVPRYITHEDGRQEYLDAPPEWEDDTRIWTIAHSPLWYGYRYIGVRLIPHLACSFDCVESLMMTDEWGKLADVSPIMEVLGLPCAWDCYRGIAEITTPYFRIITNSVPCSVRYIVRKEGL